MIKETVGGDGDAHPVKHGQDSGSELLMPSSTGQGAEEEETGNHGNPYTAPPPQKKKKKK